MSLQDEFKRLLGSQSTAERLEEQHAKMAHSQRQQVSFPSSAMTDAKMMQLMLQAEQERVKAENARKEQARKIMRQKLLESPAYAMPLSTLRGVWLARWGDGWVPAESLQDDDEFDSMWRPALMRLKNAHEIEEHLDAECVRLKT